MKRIAAITMLRDDDFFVEKWVAYYGAQLGRENLYVWFDGLDQRVPPCCEGCHTGKIEHLTLPVHQGDKRRIDFLSARARELFERGYEIVIGGDVDEFLVPDPAQGVGLAAFLSRLETGRASVSALGIDVGQDLRTEGTLEKERPMLEQRSFAKLSTRYSKAAALLRPCDWGSGFHRVRGRNFHIVKDLYLFHFGCVDLRRIEERLENAGLRAEGWERHLRKRSGTITLVSHARARDFAKWTAIARRVQNCIRPPYAWNKPAMFELRIVVRIPERFKTIGL